MNAGVGVVFGQQPKPGPRVQPWTVRSGAGGVFLPGVGRDQRRQRIDAERAGVGGHAPVGRDRQHISQTVAADGRAQPWVGAVDLVAGHPCGGNFGCHGAVDQRRLPASVWSRNPAGPAVFPRQRSGRGPRSRTWVGTGRGRSTRAHAGRRRSDTPRLGSSRCARRSRSTGAAPRRLRCPS